MDDPGDRLADTGETRTDLSGKGEAVTNRMTSPEATNLEKVLMAISGAAEGLAEQIRTSNLPETTRTAFSKTTESLKGVREGFREGYPASTTSQETYRTPSGYQYPKAQPPGVGETVAKGETRVADMASAVSEATSRAAKAPTAIGYEVKTAAKEVVKEARGVAVGYGLAGVLGLFALAFFSALIAMLLNYALGGQWGTFIVALAYAIGALVAFMYAKRHLNETKIRARTGMTDIKREVRTEAEGIKRPFREGMGGSRPGA